MLLYLDPCPRKCNHENSVSIIINNTVGANPNIERCALKIIADENIPLVQELFSAWGEVICLPGRQINAAAVKNADILLVRSVTSVNQDLLANSYVKFVGSATTGIDHVDTAWLNQAGIAFANAHGANAKAVAEYVICCVAALRQQGLLCQPSLRAGVIGVGHVGSQVVKKLEIVGFEVWQNDPPKQQQDSNFISVPLGEFHDLDLICLHTPLTKTGAYPTFHLIEKNFLQRQKPGTVLLNAGRGAVINSNDLLLSGSHLITCLDVWEHEPNINLNLLRRTTLATPHIAGYTLAAKVRGTTMLYHAAYTALKLSVPFVSQPLEPIIELPSLMSNWEETVLQVYNPLLDTERTHQTLLETDDVTASFDYLRKHHLQRHEFDSVIVKKNYGLLSRLGFIVKT